MFEIAVDEISQGEKEAQRKFDLNQQVQFFANFRWKVQIQQT
jgi:hypothetical protein